MMLREIAEDCINWGLEREQKERKIFSLDEIYEPRNRWFGKENFSFCSLNPDRLAAFGKLR